MYNNVQHHMCTYKVITQSI